MTTPNDVVATDIAPSGSCQTALRLFAKNRDHSLWVIPSDVKPGQNNAEIRDGVAVDGELVLDAVMPG